MIVVVLEGILIPDTLIRNTSLPKVQKMDSNSVNELVNYLGG